MSEYLCPHCQKPIYDEEALLCHFCGESLKRPGKGLLSNIKYGHPYAWILAAVALAVIIAFLMIL